MNKLGWVWLAVMCAAVACANADEDRLRGLWLTSRGGPNNQGRATAPAGMKQAPEEVWSMPTGGTVASAHSFSLGEGEGLLLQVGSTLEAVDCATGERVWRNCLLGVASVLRVDDFDGDGAAEALVRTGPRKLELLSCRTGERLWAWRSAASTHISGHAFERMPGGLRFICFPAYSTIGYCLDFSGDARKPATVWRVDHKGRYHAGFGPSVVLADMDGDGRKDVVLSGKGPSVYHAVIDADTGQVKTDVHYRVEKNRGRPYGLFQVVDLDGGGAPDVVMVSCQVEEYVTVALNAGGGRLEKLWDRFVEKDWPKDHRELRPQVTSLTDLQGDGKVEMALGLWEGGRWRTLIIDPLKGFDAQRGVIDGCYFWGCHDLTGDAVPEVIVSRENARRTGKMTTLMALDGRSLQPVAELGRAAAFASQDSPLPENVYFMAQRRSPVPLTAGDGMRGILVRTFADDAAERVALWGSAPGGPVTARPIAQGSFARVDLCGDGILLSAADGTVRRFDAGLNPVGRPWQVNGRACRPLVWSNGGRRELVVDLAGGVVLGGTPELGAPGRLSEPWRVPGTMPALHVDSAGRSRVATADLSNRDRPAAVIWGDPRRGVAASQRIPLAFPPYLGLIPFGSEFRLLVNLQTGVHTMALACYDADGKLLWEDREHGAHPNVPAAADLDGDGRYEVVADDHGQLRFYSAAGKELWFDKGWPPAYSLPIIGPFGPDGQPAALRAGGIWGLALMDRSGKRLWMHKLPKKRLFRWYLCSPAVGRPTRTGGFAVGLVAEDGAFECIDVATGRMRWSVDLGEPPVRADIAAFDADGDGSDEFLVGARGGRLACIAEREAKGVILWEKWFPAEVASPVAADVDGDGLAEVILSTSDGLVRILK